MLFCLQFERRIHINHQLQLQPVIQIQQGKCSVARFVINDLYIHLIVRLTGIHTVNPAPQTHLFLLCQLKADCLQMIGLRKRHLKITRRKTPLLHLDRERPHRAPDRVFHARQQIAVLRLVECAHIRTARNRVIHALLNPRLTRLFGQIVPGIRRPADALRKMPQRVMIDISHIHTGKLL